MDADSAKVQAYLYKLNEMTGSDPLALVSMYEVGDALGIEREDAAQMAETLFIGGQAELKTLSGGIGITLMGMKVLGVPPAQAPGSEPLTLSNEVVLNVQDLENVETLLADIKSGIASETVDYQTLETLVMDIKTIEIQLLSPAPKTAVVREVLKSIGLTLPRTDFPEIASRIAGMVKKDEPPTS